MVSDVPSEVVEDYILSYESDREKNDPKSLSEALREWASCTCRGRLIINSHPINSEQIHELIDFEFKSGRGILSQSRTHCFILSLIISKESRL